jgi:hypothetical protein
MKNLRVLVYSSLCVLSFALHSPPAKAEGYRYHYVSLDNLSMPKGFAGFTFSFAAFGKGDEVYGNICNDAFLCHPAVYDAGHLTVLPSNHSRPIAFYLGVVKNRSLLGGGVPDPADPFASQAAILRNDRLELIPQDSAGAYSFVFAFTHSGVLVDSLHADGGEAFFFFRNGRTTPVDLSQLRTPFFLNVNRDAVFVGTEGSPYLDARAFRLDTRTGKKTQLDPLPSEPLSWGVGINKRGDVLGYSFVVSHLERIGVWNSEGQFQTYFVEGTPEVRPFSNWLVFNDHNVIAITQTSDGNSYLVPQAGQRLNLADLTDNLPAVRFPLQNVRAINNRGSLLGNGIEGGQFLLQRVGRDGDDDDDDDGDGECPE